MLRCLCFLFLVGFIDLKCISYSLRTLEILLSFQVIIRKVSVQAPVDNVNQGIEEAPQSAATPNSTTNVSDVRKLQFFCISIGTIRVLLIMVFVLTSNMDKNIEPYAYIFCDDVDLSMHFHSTSFVFYSLRRLKLATFRELFPTEISENSFHSPEKLNMLKCKGEHWLVKWRQCN